MSEMPSTRSSFTRRSCKVRLARSTRPLAWLEFAQDLDVQLGEGATELRHALSAPGLWLVDAKRRMLVGIKGHRAAVNVEITAQDLEVRVRAFGPRSAANLARSLSSTLKHPSQVFFRRVEGDISNGRGPDTSTLRLHLKRTESFLSRHNANEIALSV
jgi:hypothetical protein